MLEAILNFVDRIVLTITPALNKFVAALIILFIGFIVGKFVGGLLLKILQDVRVDETGKKMLNTNISLATSVSSLVMYGIYIATFLFALNFIGITRYVVLSLVVVFFIILIIAFMIALKDFLPNIITGFQTKKQYSVGKHLRYKGVEGTITKRSLLRTRVEAKNGDVFLLPNKLFRRKA